MDTQQDFTEQEYAEMSRVSYEAFREARRQWNEEVKRKHPDWELLPMGPHGRRQFPLTTFPQPKSAPRHMVL